MGSKTLVKKRILVLGSSGMLGWMVSTYLSKNPTLIIHSAQRTIDKKRSNHTKHFEVDAFLENPKNFSYIKTYDYIINCIGIIKPFCKDDDPIGVRRAISVNAYFPHKLAEFSKTRVIQIATDCVYSGTKGEYTEDAQHDPLDVYGKTKSLGEVRNNHVLHIRCSIIGPEKKNKLSLLEWFLQQKKASVLSGFTNHLWNGVTTLQFAKLCEAIITESMFEKLVAKSNLHHFVPHNPVNKYALLQLFATVFEKDVVVTKVQAPTPVDRTLATNYHMLEKLFGKTDMKKALVELKEFSNAHLR